jgi:thioredoxin 1
MIKIIRFTASWCQPCKILAPTFNELSEEFSKNASFSTIDIDQNSSIAEQYNIRSVPQIIIEKDGKEVRRIVGVKPKSTYISEINILI